MPMMVDRAAVTSRILDALAGAAEPMTAMEVAFALKNVPSEVYLRPLLKEMARAGVIIAGHERRRHMPAVVYSLPMPAAVPRSARRGR